MKMNLSLQMKQELRLEECRVAFDDLSRREETVLDLHYGEGWNMAKIGRKFCVSRERIRQIKEKAIRKLKKKEPLVMFLRWRQEDSDGAITLCEGQRNLIDAILGKE